jgi:predicted  nucleic acid-binding Zn-ribbon protein
MEIKCSKCGKMFEKISTRTMCKECNREYNQSNKQHIKEYNKNRYEGDKEVILGKIKEYARKNPEITKKCTKDWFANNKDHVAKYTNDKYHNNHGFKVKTLLRCSLNNNLKNIKINKTHSVIKMMGCSSKDLAQHIEQQFLPEMNWTNHGKIWELDHILPCASFDLTVLEEQYKCFHYTNFQPLFKTTEIAESFGYNDHIGNRNKKDKIL